MRSVPVALFLTLSVLSVSCSSSTPTETVLEPRVVTLPPPNLDAMEPVNVPGLHNLVAYHEGLYSGSVPEGKEGFESLAAMGIRTVISVDGAAPDVKEAKKHGLRYVHLPIGYDGMSRERADEIARAIHDLPGPVYVHCHHGKHRSAAATGSAAVILGYMTSAEATGRMKVSGTAPNYKGLYKCVAEATVADERRLDRASAAFPEIAKTTGFVHSMVEIDEIFDQLKAIEKAGWKAPSDHPDLVPVAEAARLENLFRNLLSDAEVISKGAELLDWMKDSAAHAQSLEDLLGKTPVSAEAASASFKVLTQDCKQCHTKYRDVVL